MKRTLYIIHGTEGSGKTINVESFQRCFRAAYHFDEGEHEVYRKFEMPSNGDVLILVCPGSGIVDRRGLLCPKWVKKNVPETFAVKVFNIQDAAELCRARGVYVNFPPFFATA